MRAELQTPDCSGLCARAARDCPSARKCVQKLEENQGFHQWAQTALRMDGRLESSPALCAFLSGFFPLACLPPGEEGLHCEFRSAHNFPSPCSELQAQLSSPPNVPISLIVWVFSFLSGTAEELGKYMAGVSLYMGNVHSVQEQQAALLMF